MKLTTLLTGLFLALCAVSAAASSDSPLRDAGIARGLQLAGVDDPDARKVYIVQLRTPSAAEFHSTLYKTATVAPVGKPSQPRLDKASPAISTYAEKLGAEQDAFLSRTAPDARKLYSYRYGFNGFAAEMTAAQAHKLENMPEVLHVWEDEIRPLATNFSPGFLGLFDSDGGLRGPEGLDGDGVVIGFIDSGVYPEHPHCRIRRKPTGQACAAARGPTSLFSAAGCAAASTSGKTSSFTSRRKTGTASARRAPISPRRIATTR